MPSLLGHPRIQLHAMPALDDVPQRGIHHPLLLQHGSPLEGRARDVNGVHAAAAAGHVADQELGRAELLAEEVGDGLLGRRHGGLRGL